ncbi:RNA polymerase sigma factor [Variovorax soli]|uniref:RNA polymerase sigma-70 factor (ECF subfamily) n=1 Tax=Variovorax soli TaxID=376815 RepID=A0ABU1NEV2_9BURK|nr:RNA polymerase sigma factor [Variovorax soli]MDR6536944.1 RNA polymerase sigma-70 factor (ECF subfamily) [Variovorax soli]
MTHVVPLEERPSPIRIDKASSPEPAQRPPRQPVAAQDKEKVFRGLVKDYGAALHYFVLRRVGNPTDAEEVAQQALVEAAASFTAFRGEAEVSTWTFGIATNLIRNHLNRSPERRYVFESADILEEQEDPSGNPFDLLARRQAMHIVACKLGELPSGMAEALILVSVDGLSYEDTALQLGVPVGTVRSRISRARSAIRALLREAGCDGCP